MENNEEVKNIEAPNSVKFAMNAKGYLSGECKVYAKTPEEALAKATSIIAQMEVIIGEKNK